MGVDDREIAATMNIIAFDPADALLSAAASQHLASLAEFLAAHVEFAVVLEDDTDRAGNDEHGLSLARQRAAAVKDFLVEKGIDPARLQRQGHRETDPVKSNAPTLRRTENRNVALVVSYEIAKLGLR
jgi:outer membrane protein OmpA-like peptidoglycan-associated protein